MSAHASDESPSDDSRIREGEEEEEDDEDEEEEAVEEAEEEAEEEAGEGAAEECIKEPGAISRQKQCIRWTTNMLSQLRVKLVNSQENGGADFAKQWTKIAKEVDDGFVHVLAKNHGQGFRLSGAMVKSLFKQYASWRKAFPNAGFEHFDPAAVQKQVRAANAAKARAKKASMILKDDRGCVVYSRVEVVKAHEAACCKAKACHSLDASGSFVLEKVTPTGGRAMSDSYSKTLSEAEKMEVVGLILGVRIRPEHGAAVASWLRPIFENFVEA